MFILLQSTFNTAFANIALAAIPRQAMLNSGFFDLFLMTTAATAKLRYFGLPVLSNKGKWPG